MTTPTTTPQPAPAAPSPSVRGRFVWHDYMTPDIEKAKAFYSAVFGWGSEAFGAFDYTMWTADGVPRGGYGPFTDEMRASGVPPHWITYIAMPDVDAAVAEARALGATVAHGPEDIPEVGRFAILQDPQGALFSLFSSHNVAPEEAEAPVGEVSWHELWTTDAAAAYDFYVKLCGWQPAGEFADPAIGVYRMFGRGGAPLGGVAQIMPGMDMPPNWLPYVRVSDLDAAVERVRQQGGQVLAGPMEVPGGDRVAQCRDALGGAFAMHQTAG